jgi:hypothetical protein
VSIYRRTGADLPFGDPVPSHGTEMEGWFWRLSDLGQGKASGTVTHQDQRWELTDARMSCERRLSAAVVVQRRVRDWGARDFRGHFDFGPPRGRQPPFVSAVLGRSMHTPVRCNAMRQTR